MITEDCTLTAPTTCLSISCYFVVVLTDEIKSKNIPDIIYKNDQKH